MATIDAKVYCVEQKTDVDNKSIGGSEQTESNTIPYDDKKCVRCRNFSYADDFFGSLCGEHKLCSECIRDIFFSFVDVNEKDEKLYIKDRNCFVEIGKKHFVDTIVDLKLPLDDFYLDPDHVIENIYIGSILSAANLKKMQDFGTTHVIIMGIDLKKFFPKHFEYDVFGLSDAPLYLSGPKDKIGISDCDKISECIHQNTSKPGKVLVHCAMGMSRSSTAICAYLIRYKFMTYDEAVTFLGSKHKNVAINFKFEKVLKEYEEYCRKNYQAEPDKTAIKNEE